MFVYQLLYRFCLCFLYSKVTNNDFVPNVISRFVWRPVTVLEVINIVNGF